jgi:hypothetical protein
MDLLKEVEDQVGSHEAWPTYILLHIFVDMPNDDTLKKVCAFLYGNDVHQKTATDFLTTCRPKGANPQRIHDAVRHWYSTWEGQPDVEHLAMYYNVYERSIMWINGDNLDLGGVVEPWVSVPEIGVECMKYIDPEAWSSLKSAIEELFRDEGEDVDILDEGTGVWRNVRES